VPLPDGADDLQALLDEQQAYYRARAPEYTETAIPELPRGKLGQARDEALRALESFRPSGDVLELACGPGTWTRELLRYAQAVTALDGAPEMLALARSKVRDDRVRFIRADVFDWEPDRRYDVVFFAFWLSHVPLERFELFWSLVCRCLIPGGRVAFVDDAYRTPDELLDGEDSQIVHRRLQDGRPFRAIKVPHRPEDLERRLRDLGWPISVRRLAGSFFWGQGRMGG
jgi:demethylmenaquinone methyltransferase/2-methoxy-6-polyprenyl-1,4-benzoquinol methylase